MHSILRLQTSILENKEKLLLVLRIRTYWRWENELPSVGLLAFIRVTECAVQKESLLAVACVLISVVSVVIHLTIKKFLWAIACR